MKFLVLWRMELSLLSSEMAAAVARMSRYAKPLEQCGTIVARYHLVGQHGGAWIYEVGSHEEFERVLAMSPVYNFAHYEVHALAEMPDPERQQSMDGLLTNREGGRTLVSFVEDRGVR